MSFRRALLGFALCALAPAAAWPVAARAEGGKLVEGGYEITFAGFAGFRIDFTARFDGTSYDVESHAFKEGVMKAITMNYEGRNRAWGNFSSQGAQPSGGSLSLSVGGTPRTWLAQYGADGSIRETHSPKWDPTPKDAIPEDKKRGSLDPLTAAIAAGMKGDAACDQPAPSNDGRRRIDVMLHKLRMETPAQAGLPEAKGEVMVCELYSKRVAGQFFDAAEEDESQREAPMLIWLARFDDTPFRYPARLEAKTGFGTIRGKLLSFKERPLTDDEKIAMRH
jgi:hypothetical protein